MSAISLNDQKIVWIKDPVQDIIKSQAVFSLCIIYCESVQCKVNCSKQCGIHVPEI